MHAVRHFLKEFVPVPEIYGWRTEGLEVFLYMEYMPGRTLERAWDTLRTDDRTSICQQLQTIVDNLRQLEQNQNDKFVGRSGLIPTTKAV
jgi:aminoglycoside phosphotransferase (APT) family kinase protein